MGKKKKKSKTIKEFNEWNEWKIKLAKFYNNFV